MHVGGAIHHDRGDPRLRDTLLDMMTLRGPQVTEYLHSKQVWAGDLGIVSLQMLIEAI